MTWYFVLIPIVSAVLLSLAIPYIRKRFIENLVICSVCKKKYNVKDNKNGCPNCGVGLR